MVERGRGCWLLVEVGRSGVSGSAGSVLMSMSGESLDRDGPRHGGGVGPAGWVEGGLLC